MENIILQHLMELPLNVTIFAGVDYPSTLNILILLLNIMVTFVMFSIGLLGLWAIKIAVIPMIKDKVFSESLGTLLFGVFVLGFVYWGLTTPHNEHHVTMKRTETGIVLGNNAVYVQTLAIDQNDFLPYKDIVNISVKPSTVQMRRGSMPRCIITFYLKDGTAPTFAILDAGMKEINLISCHN